VVLVAAVFGGWWVGLRIIAHNTPAHETATTVNSASAPAGADPTAIQAGVCLSMSARVAEGVQELSDLVAAMVTCDSTTSRLRVIGIDNYDSSIANPAACDTSDWTSGCWWDVYSSGSGSQAVSFETIVRKGECFFGYTNTVNSNTTGWDKLLGDCGGQVSAWETSSDMTEEVARNMGVKQTQIRLVEFTITKTGKSSALTCAHGEYSWGSYYTKGKETFMCLSAKSL